jgi:DNA repair exonuclease SbcCD nuclease subunit
MAKILITADLHLHDYSAHNFTPNGRLKQFITLAQLMNKTIHEQNIEAVIIAGDLLNSTEIRPRTYHYLHKFLKTLLAGLGTPFDNFQKVFIISGNHDLDSKTEFDAKDTYLSNLSEIPLVQYVHNEMIHLGGREFYFRGWVPKSEPVPKCDVFVTHEYINGATLPSGLVVKNIEEKFDTPYLLKIAGDIHKYQVLDNILIPGTPIQKSFADDPNTGFCILDTETLTHERVSTATNTDFIKFWYDDNPIIEKVLRVQYNGKTFHEHYCPTFEEYCYEKRIVYREKKTKTVDQFLQLKPVESIDLNTVLKTFLTDFEYVEELYSVLGNVDQSLDNFINRELKVNLLDIEIYNFKSIEHAYVNFETLHNLSIITAPNGFGKTTLFQAILWGLTGDSPGEVDDIIQKGKTYCEIILTLNYEGKLICIERSRGNKFELLITIDSVPLTASTKSDLQKKLVEILPILTKLHLLYFYQSRDGLLSELSDTSRVSLISELSGQTVVNQLSDKVENHVNKLKIISEELKQTYDQLASRLKGLLEVYVETEDPEEKIKLYEQNLKILNEREFNLQQQKENLILDIIKTSEDQEEFIRKEIKQAEKEIKDFQIKETSLINDAVFLNKIIEMKEDWVCDKCKSVIKTKDFDVNNIVDAKQKLQKETIELNKLQEKISTLQSLIAKAEEEIRGKKTELSLKIETITFEINKQIKEAFERNKEAQQILSDLMITKGEFLKNQKLKHSIEQLKQQTESSLNNYLFAKNKHQAFATLNKTVFGNDGLFICAVLERLTDLINTNSEVKIELFKKQKNGKIKPTLNISMKDEKGFWIDYRQLSGGERLYADLVFLKSLINFVGGIGFILLDETFKFFSKDYLEKSFQILSSIAVKNLFLIYHGDLLSEIKSYSNIKVRKLQGNSQYEIINKGED